MNLHREDSLEYMNHAEAMDWYCRPLSRWQKLRAVRFRLKYWIKTRINLRILAHEAKHEDPKGGADEVNRLREHLYIERRYLEKP
jgi:hypothetical protein